MTLRVVVVDDEPIARRRVRRLLGGIGGVEVVGEAGDGEAAVARVVSMRPDLILLDVEMPGPDGLEVARRLLPIRPVVVFLTAHERYAVQAFEVHAVGYLLKPVSRERLATVIDRARIDAARGAVADDGLAAALDELARHRAAIRRLPVRTHGRVELVDEEAIDWIEAADNYSVLHCGRRAHLIRDTLARLDRTLDPARFLRIHRSAIVHLDRIDRLEPAGRGDYRVVLRDGSRLSLSRTHRDRLERVLGRRL
jgi:two-component system LytT family response regulator